MTQLFTVLKRNFRLMFNSKLSSLMIIIGPVLLIMIIGLTIKDNSLKSITASVYSGDRPVNEDFVSLLKSRSFMIHDSDTLGDCKADVISSDSQVCLEYLEVVDQFTGRRFYDLVLYVDFSKQRIVWSVIGSVQGVVDDQNSNIRQVLINSLTSDLDSLISNLESRRESVREGISATGVLIDSSNRFLESEKQIDSLVQTRSSIISWRQQVVVLKSLGVDTGTLDAELAAAEGSMDSIILANQFILDDEGISSIPSRLSSLQVELRDVDSSMTSVLDRLKTLRNTDIDRLADPIHLSYDSAKDSDANDGLKSEARLSFIDYLFPSLVMFFVLFSALIFVTTFIIKDRSSNAYIRNIVSRSSGFSFVMGNFLSGLLIVFVQVALIVFISSFFVNFSLINNLSGVAVIILVSVCIFSVLGMFIGYFFSTSEGGVIASVSVALLFLIFTPIITPVETLPPIIGKFVNHTPLVILENKLRLTTLFDVNPVFSVYEVLSLIAAFVGSWFLVFIAYFRSKRREI